MVKVAMLTPIPLLLLLLISCSKADPVDEDAVAPPDGIVGDASATGLAAEANSSAAEAARQAALPSSTDGLRWTLNQAERIAQFGPPGSPALAIQCQKPREGQPQLVFIRYLPPVAGSQATLSFTGNGQAASLPVSAISNPGGIGGHWRSAVPPNEHARDVAETFAGPGSVEVSVSGTPPLVVTSGAEPRRALAECLGS